MTKHDYLWTRLIYYYMVVGSKTKVNFLNYCILLDLFGIN